jgi:hypothetical protein
MNLRIDLNEPKILAKVNGGRFGLFVSNEWKRLIDPYTPRDTGTMQGSARVKPWEIHYTANYSEYVYYMSNARFQKKNPYSTYEWDIAAEKAGQKDKLYRILNNALQSGMF